MASSLRLQPSSSLRIAGAGPMLIISGGTPTVAVATTRTRGWIPRDLAYGPEPISAAAAPSTIAELFPPVCTPPNDGRIFDSVSYGDGRTCVSAVTDSTRLGKSTPRGL